jgi:hypothetical protein
VLNTSAYAVVQLLWLRQKQGIPIGKMVIYILALLCFVLDVASVAGLCYKFDRKRTATDVSVPDQLA